MNHFWIKLNGESMGPLLLDADEVVIEEVPFSSAKRGDVVLFLDQKSRELTLHRLIDFPFITKGDFSWCAEENPKEAFIGKAIGFSRHGAYRKLPASGSIMGLFTLTLSRHRMRGFVGRKMALIGLIFLSKIYAICSDKTRVDHSEELNLGDL